MGIGGWGLPLIMRQPLSYSPIPISGPNPHFYIILAPKFLTEIFFFSKNR